MGSVLIYAMESLIDHGLHRLVKRRIILVDRNDNGNQDHAIGWIVNIMPTWLRQASETFLGYKYLAYELQFGSRHVLPGTNP